MAYRDRLAASRAQRGGQNIELSNIPHESPLSSPANGDGNLADLSTFLAEDTSIQQGITQMRDNVTQLGALRLRSLGAIDDSTEAESNRIDTLTIETRGLMQSLKARIQRMEAAPIKADAHLRSNRISLLRSKFVEVLQEYQKEEQEGRAKSRARVERQLKIVKPDATQEEVTAAVSGGGQQIFAQALTTSTRYGESRAAYREVQERQQDLLKVESTLAELAQMFQEMATLVEQQDATINIIETSAQGVADDTEKGLKNTEKAIIIARAYRKKRWICFFITLIVIAILAIVLGIVFGKK
ncbi:syntaxin-like protein [Pholiota conissans]|uniref:Syntaxin-like protein n=1 Tax=Pholiota conissans TaxID=109636 RepID=A0A9P5Z9F0_9AGAR|nr:syntaxin-like protein [Pholiota conissans]